MGWQENYKDVVEKSFTQFQHAVESIDNSKEVLELIHKRYQDNLTINDEVKSTLALLKIEHESLEEKCRPLFSLLKKQKPFPLIDDNIDRLTNGFSDKVESSIEAVTEAYKIQTDNNIKVVEEMNSATDSALSAMKDAVENSNESIVDAANLMKQNVDESMTNIADRVVQGFNDSMINVEQLQQKFADSMEGTIVQIDDALRQELEKSLQSLGSQLASLSKRFVDDYADLTNRMQQVINMAES